MYQYLQYNVVNKLLMLESKVLHFIRSISEIIEEFFILEKENFINEVNGVNRPTKLIIKNAYLFIFIIYKIIL